MLDVREAHEAAPLETGRFELFQVYWGLATFLIFYSPKHNIKTWDKEN